MVIKSTLLPNTGLYQQKVRQVVLRSDDQESLNDFVSLLQEATSSKRLDDPLFLSHLEAEATGFLKAYAASDIPGYSAKVPSEATSDELEFVVFTHIERARRDLYLRFQEHLSEEEKREANRRLIKLGRAGDACEMLHLISVIRDQVEYGSNEVRYGRVEQVFSHGFALGRAYERFRVRTAEPKAWTGDKVLQAVSKGGIAAKAAGAQRYPRIVAKFKASGLSQRRFADATGIPRSTLQQALKRVDSNLSK
jgi:hypothetical protein